MTQYLLSVIHAEGLPHLSEDEVQESFTSVDAFNHELLASGRWVFAGGLQPPSSATVVDAAGADVLITDGPFSEAKEQLGGFWIVEAADLDEALDIAKAGSAACRNPVEVRPFQAEPDQA
ncbi:MAG: YCII-related [Marmoricola sp.]|nr:YCII-related [Marmoricola sp.]